MAGAGKLILGIIFLIAGLWLVIPAAWLESLGICFNYCPGLWQELWFLIKAVVPIGLVVLGLLLIWIEAEEVKVSKPKRKK